MTSLLWDVFCRVVDNHGDLGVCLRLARQLVARGQRVRLWIDDAAALRWMASSPDEHAWAHPWPQDTWHVSSPGDVVIEAFGCHLPACVEARIAAAPPRAWINLEYLSAEAWVARSHGLQSPVMSGPAKGLSKRFCFPGFSPDTGGLLAAALPPLGGAPLPPAALQAIQQAQSATPSQRLVSLFCYPHAPLGALLQRLAQQDTHVLVLGGDAVQSAAQQAHAALPVTEAQHLKLTPLPWLNQAQYDTLLAQCDLNVVRGEDSFVRAQWAGKPLLWQLYHQDDGAHADKLEAFLDRWLGDGPNQAAWRQAWRAWNGLLPAEVLASSSLDGLGNDGELHALQWRETLRTLPNLVDVLQHWALANPAPSPPAG
jgi:uncharacterized repeat protein (TIGR03837 family)